MILNLAWHHIYSANTQAYLGYRLANEHGTKNRGIAGIQYRLPGLVMSDVGIDTEGDVRLGLGKEIQLTDRLALLTEIEYDTGTQFEGVVGLSWTLNKPLSLVTQYHSEYGFGGGVEIRF